MTISDKKSTVLALHGGLVSWPNFWEGEGISSCPVFSAPLFLDVKCWVDWITVGKWLQGRSEGLRSWITLLQTLRLSPQPPCHFSRPLTFWLPPCLVSNGLTLYYLDRVRPLGLTFPFAGNLEQSFTNHAAKCKISKLLILQALMKWLALLCCNYGKRSEL